MWKGNGGRQGHSSGVTGCRASDTEQSGAEAGVPASEQMMEAWNAGQDSI